MPENERSADVDRVRTQLWEMIREHQAQGHLVRNRLMSKRFGGRWGYYAYEKDLPPDGNHNSTRCLLGLAGVEMYVDMVPAMERLNISHKEARFLEAGFEGLSPANADEDGYRYLLQKDLSLKSIENLATEPFYMLGREIGEQLEKEEAAAMGIKAV